MATCLLCKHEEQSSILKPTEKVGHTLEIKQGGQAESMWRLSSLALSIHTGSVRGPISKARRAALE